MKKKIAGIGLTLAALMAGCTTPPQEPGVEKEVGLTIKEQAAVYRLDQPIKPIKTEEDIKKAKEELKTYREITGKLQKYKEANDNSRVDDLVGKIDERRFQIATKLPKDNAPKPIPQAPLQKVKVSLIQLATEPGKYANQKVEVVNAVPKQISMVVNQPNGSRLDLLLQEEDSYLFATKAKKDPIKGTNAAMELMLYLQECKEEKAKIQLIGTYSNNNQLSIEQVVVKGKTFNFE
ncbi:hypothetical protein HY643_02060 [Candidatus Woesearchaeota archaeon]|nr:hypothetical protein [Candidatus Woesearchaeota archaeon]